MENNQEINLEDNLQNLFNTSVSGSGEEELLRIASDFSLQLTARQIKALLFLKYSGYYMTEKGQEIINEFLINWLKYKRQNNSDLFVMKALEFISLRKFLNEQSFKVNIEK